jgi:hypothetical protein
MFSYKILKRLKTMIGKSKFIPAPREGSPPAERFPVHGGLKTTHKFCF